MKRIAILMAIMMATMMSVSAQKYYGRVQDTDGYTNIRRSASTTAATGKCKGVAYDPADTYINVRKGPGTSYAIASQLLNGTTIYLEGSGKWLKVYDEDMRYLGYAHRSVVR